MGRLNINAEKIEDYEIDVRNEGDGNVSYQAIYLTIKTNIKSHQYKISTDVRFPEIPMITEILERGLERSKMELGKNFNIDEEPERFYIYVSYSPEGQFQFAGKRLI